MKRGKEQGLLAELMVKTELIRRGFMVSQCQGDYCGYDLICDWEGKLSRIQVKSTATSRSTYHKSSCRVIAGRGCSGKIKLTKNDCDTLVIVCLKEMVYFVIPIESVHCLAVTVFPHFPLDKPLNSRGNPKYHKYREAWDLLK